MINRKQSQLPPMTKAYRKTHPELKLSCAKSPENNSFTHPFLPTDSTATPKFSSIRPSILFWDQPWVRHGAWWFSPLKTMPVTYLVCPIILPDFQLFQHHHPIYHYGNKTIPDCLSIQISSNPEEQHRFPFFHDWFQSSQNSWSMSRWKT